MIKNSTEQSLRGVRQMLKSMTDLRVVPSAERARAFQQDLRELLIRDGERASRSMAVRALGLAGIGIMPSRDICATSVTEVDDLIRREAFGVRQTIKAAVRPRG